MNEWIGKQLGQYEIVAEIGRGGMAVVYKARQPSLGRHVALKVLPAHLAADQGFVARFEREARAAAQLNHSHIVTIHDVGQEQNTHFIVMEYLEGQSLYDVLKAGGPLPLEKVIHIVRQVASALDYAHERGFVHRDIKPANIILGPGDHATLTDFGIAKAMSGTSLTQTGGMVGTPQYMAPEQIQGMPVDPRTDVYALGIVCYEMLSGAPPFTGDTAAILYAQAHKPPPPLGHHLPGLPAYVESVLIRALHKDPDGRFSSAGEMAEALATRVSAPSTATAPTPFPSSPRPSTAIPGTPQPPPRSARVRRRRSRGMRPGLWLGVGAAVVLILGAVLAIALFGGGSGQTEQPAQPTQTDTVPSPTVSPPTDTSPPTVASISPSGSTSPSLRLVFALGSPGDGDIYLTDVEGLNQRRLVGGRDDQAEPDWSPDEGRIAFQSNQAGNYDIWVIDADGVDAQQLTTASADEREPDWSPDGREIVYRRGGEPNGDGELWVITVDNGNQRQLAGQSIKGRAPIWSPDGQQVVFMSERDDSWNIFILDLSSGETRRLSDCSSHCRFPSWSPDGQYVVYHSTQSESSFTPIQIWRQRADGSEPATRLIEGNDPGRAVWSAEGLIAFNTDEAIDIINADGTDRRTLHNSEDGWAPDWSR